MKPADLIIRCFAEKKDDVWQAFCLNFDLAVQGESMEEVQEKMEAIIESYVYDALAEDGVDRKFAYQLMTRKAPLSVRAKYYFIALRCNASKFRKDLCKFMAFDAVLPMVPKHHA